MIRPSLPSPQHTIRALALRVLKGILRNQPIRFKNYAELTIMKTLEAHKDSHKEVRPPTAQIWGNHFGFAETLPIKTVA